MTYEEAAKCIFKSNMTVYQNGTCVENSKEQDAKNQAEFGLQDIQVLRFDNGWALTHTGIGVYILSRPNEIEDCDHDMVIGIKAREKAYKDLTQ